MKKLVIATGNQGKLREITQILRGMELISLKDLAFDGIIDEPFDTFEENAEVKAAALHRFSGLNVLAEDSGLCVPALGGAPGVRSARYAGDNADDRSNLMHLLKQMEGITDRAAYYKAVLCLIWEGRRYYFEGICRGKIAAAPEGSGGFGYDPVFIPEGYEESFGSLPDEVKNRISHRAAALAKLDVFLTSQQTAENTGL